MLYNLKKIDLIPSLKISNLKLSPNIKEFFKKFGPGALGAGVTQINIWVDLVIATFFSGAVAFLYYADRVNQLPLSLIGTAMGTALLPTLSKNIAAKDPTLANKNYNNSIFTVLLLTIPATSAFLVMSKPLISVLFERGEFDAVATLNSANALLIYSLGLPAFALIKVFASCFFAQKDTKTPVRAAIYALVTNIILNIIFVFLFQEIGIQPHLGLALATSLSGWCNAIFLFLILNRNSYFKLYSNFVVRLAKIIIASFIMAIALHFSFSILSLGVINLLFIVFLGIFVYFAAIFLLKAINFNDIKSIIRREYSSKKFSKKSS
jgi:putative peptidoglycan lipid II flippase